MVGNYFKAGPWSRQGRYMEHDTLGALVSVYSRGNVGDPGQLDGSADQRWFITYRAGGGPVPGSVYASAPISVPLVPLTEVDAHAAYESVLTGVGASAALTCDGRWRPARDRLDALMIDQVRNRTGPGADDENDHPDDYGGVPDLAAGDPCPDLDGDGMPDAFEARWGLDPADPTDVSDDPDDDGYTNVEEFVNGTAPSSSREVR